MAPPARQTRIRRRMTNVVGEMAERCTSVCEQEDVAGREKCSSVFAQLAYAYQVVAGKIFYVPALTAIKRITVNMPPELHRALKLHAVATDTTINQCVVSAIKTHLQYKCRAVDVAPDNALD